MAEFKRGDLVYFDVGYAFSLVCLSYSCCGHDSTKTILEVVSPNLPCKVADIVTGHIIVAPMKYLKLL
jgi:hypothetical protein